MGEIGIRLWRDRITITVVRFYILMKGFNMKRSIISRIFSIFLSAAVLICSVPQSVYAGDWDWNSLREKGQQLTDTAKEGLNQAKDTTTQLANDAKEGIFNAYQTSSDYICGWVTSIDTKKFQDGWDIASKYVTSNISAQMGSDYVKSVQNAITNAQDSIRNTVNNNRTLASNAGFVAEEWATNTFNIDATAKGSKYTAERPASNGKASADVIVKKNGKVTQEIGLKYYKDGTSSAKAQTKSIIQNYNEYLAKAKKSGSQPMSFNEYLDANVKLKDAYKILNSEFASEYAGQTRLIPADQMNEAAEYLRKKIGKESAKDGTNRKALAKGYQETLDNLADKITEKDGTASIPLSEEEAKAIVDLCEKGDFNIEEFKGIKTSQMIKPKYILKQSMIAGTQAAALQAALTVGPEVYTVISDGIKNGNIDEEELKKVGVDAAFAGAEGYVEGSVSSSILMACRAGKLGTAAKNLSPDAIGTLTVLTVDSIRYGYKLSKGEITADQYGDIMAEEIFVAVVANATGATLQALLPFVPFAYLAGSMVGGMIASAGYEKGKEVVMQVAAGNGFEAIIPADVTNAISVGKETVASVDIKKVGSELKDSIVSTTNAGLIKIQCKK